MRYLKQQNINRRVANHTSVFVDHTDTHVVLNPVNKGSLQLPVGTNAQRPTSTQSNGMIRYNSDAVTGGQVEVYSAGRWRALRFTEQQPITQQNLGAGDSNNTYFGPLNATYYNPSNQANNATVGGQNIIVVVENVIQISGINYTIVNNPTIPSETYTPTLSYNAVVGASTLYFNTSLTVTGATGNGSTAVLTFSTEVQTPFAIGASITVTGILSTGGVGNYNGVFTVTASTTGSVSFASATTATYQTSGEVEASTTVYPSVDLVGGTISGTNLATSTISSYVTDPDTGALISVTFGPAIITASIVAVNTAYTIIKTSGVGSGYFLNFSTPVPYGKTVIALLGFDT
jgi:hypothetical protein